MAEPAGSGPAPSAAAPRPGRWLRVALLVSLALNLAVAGVVAGGLLAGPRMGRDLGFGPYYGAALTDADRRALRAAFRERRPERGAFRQAVRAEVEATLAALRAEPFDPAALKAALDLGSARTATYLALGKEVLAAHLAKMDPEARRAFADRLEAAAEAGPRRLRGAPRD